MLTVFMAARARLESCGKREPQLRKCPHQIVLWEVCDDVGVADVGKAMPQPEDGASLVSGPGWYQEAG